MKHLIKVALLGVGLGVSISSLPAMAEGGVNPGSLASKVLAQGVPRESLLRINKFLKENEGKDLYQEAYDCRNAPADDVTPCFKEDRTKSSKYIQVKKHRYIAVYNISLPSSQPRLFVIDLKTGTVEKYHVAHGSGSGIGAYATKFSNIEDSSQSALGLYKFGMAYGGANGMTLRLYGLEKSNDQAFNRNIVFHSAVYADPKKFGKGNPIGNSQGCPAVSADAIKRLLPLLKDGGLLDIYHPDLMDEALSGREVEAPPRK